jgi:hypothetical protein
MLRICLAAAPLGLAVALAPAASAQTVTATAHSFQEVPAISSSGTGRFRAEIDDDAIQYRLRWSGLENPVTQAHIHFARRGTNGGIVVFLCTNAGNGPEGTQACPAGDGEITGTITDADVLAVAEQGIEAGSLEQIREAIRRNAAYVNIHTTGFPAGEIRGQIAPVLQTSRED